METRANYILVGGFVLLLVAGLTVFVLWFAKRQFDTEVARYDVVFTGSVTGLNEGNPVRFSGVRVGEVIAVELDPEDPNQVLVTVELEANTPVREDTYASLEIEGLTGSRYVLLSGGSPDAEPLEPAPGRKRAVIPSRSSSLQKVLEGAPELVASANVLLARASAFLSEENQANVEAILTDMRQFSGALATKSDDIAALVGQTSETMENLNRASASMEELLAQIRDDSDRLADRAERAVLAVEQLAGSAETSVSRSADDLGALLAEMRSSARAFTNMTNEIQAMVAENREPLRDFSSNGLYELSTLLIEARDLLDGLNRVTTEVQRDPARFLFGDQQRGYEAGQP